MKRKYADFASAIINNIGDPVFVKDDNSVLILVNDAFCKFVDLNRDYILGRTLAEDIPQEEQEGFLKIDRQVLKTGKENIIEETLTVRDGQSKTISTRKTRYIDSQGKKYLIGVIRDLTERKLTEDQLKETLSQNELAVDIAELGVWQLNVDSGELLWNDRHLEFYGIPRKEFTNNIEAWRSQLHPDDKNHAERQFQEVFENKPIKDLNFRIIRPNGDIRYLVAVGVPIFKDGKLAKIIGVNRDITESEKSKKELKESEEKIRLFTQNLPDFLLQIDKTGKINYINKTLEGLTQKDVIGSSIYDWIPEGFLEQFEAKVAKVFSDGTSEIMEFPRNLLKDEPIWFESKIGPLEKTGIITQAVIVSRDISERKIAEEELLQTTKLLEASQTVAKLGGWELDLGTKDLFWTTETYRIFETSPEEFNPTIDSNVSYFLPESRKIISEAIQVAKEDGEGYDLELETYTAKGRLINIRTTCEVILKKEKPVRLIGIFQDITDLKVVEKDLKKTFSQLNLVLKTAKLGVYSFDVNTGEVIWNDRQYEIHGIDPSEFNLTLESYNKFVHPEDLEYLFDQQAEVYKNKSVYNLNFRIIRPNKEVRYINASATPVNINGELDRIIGVNEDITERKLAEIKLKKALKENIELKQQIEAENIYLKEELKLEGSFNEIVGSSMSLKKVLKQVEQVAKTDSTVLILGETGTGKELIARAIHNASDRNDQPMVKINCSALPSNLIESELFGHEKGAFPGALDLKIGRFELANGGTIFLDEIGDLPIESQTRLLRVLQESEFERLGAEKTIKVDVRVITATNRNLAKEVENNKFRQDLYYRLNVFPIKCPPLRHRLDDIQGLVHHFINKYNSKVNNKIKTVHPKTIERLTHYNWPGNIRELEHIIERAIIMNKGEQLRLGSWLMDNSLENEVSDNLRTMATMERDYIIKVLETTNWKIRGKNGAAEILGMPPTTLESRMKKRDIKR